MQECKSMYLGGDIIAAIECDYDSSKELGLTCPFCSAAVFLRSGFVRGETKVRPCFSHYAIGGADDGDCERRSISKQGLEEIRAIKTESRNQRLRLYNDFLWEMIADSLKVPSGFLNKAKFLLKEKGWDSLAEQVRELFGNQPILFRNYAEYWIDFLVKDVKRYMETNRFPEEQEILVLRNKKYIEQCDRQFHISTCDEVIGFLSSKSSSFVLKKILKLAIVDRFDRGSKNIKALTFDTYVQELPTDVFLIVLMTEWREQINKYSDKAISTRAIGFARK